MARGRAGHRSVSVLRRLNTSESPRTKSSKRRFAAERSRKVKDGRARGAARPDEQRQMGQVSARQSRTRSPDRSAWHSFSDLSGIPAEQASGCGAPALFWIEIIGARPVMSSRMRLSCRVYRRRSTSPPRAPYPTASRFSSARQEAGGGHAPPEGFALVGERLDGVEVRFERNISPKAGASQWASASPVRRTSGITVWR